MFRRVIIGNLPEFNNIDNSIDTTNKSSIKKAVEQFSNEIQIAAEPLFAKTYKICNDCKSQKVKQSKWFDEDCYIAKKKYVETRNSYMLLETEQNRINMCENKASYKRLVKRKKNHFKYLEK